MFVAARAETYRHHEGGTEVQPVVAGSVAEHDAGLGPLLNLAQDMLCVAGFDGYIRQVNPAWERALGWTAEELTGRPYIEFMHPTDRGNAADEPWRRVDGHGFAHFENRFRCRDGSYRWLSW